MTDEIDMRAWESLERVRARHAALAATNDALLAKAAAARMSLDTSPRDFERLKAESAGRKPEGSR